MIFSIYQDYRIIWIAWCSGVMNLTVIKGKVVVSVCGMEGAGADVGGHEWLGFSRMG
jgi:hypothetical protein